MTIGTIFVLVLVVLWGGWLVLLYLGTMKFSSIEKTTLEKILFALNMLIAWLIPTGMCVFIESSGIIYIAGMILGAGVTRFVIPNFSSNTRA